MPELPLAVRGEQYYLRAHLLRKLLLRFLVIAQKLRELAGLKLQPQNAELRQGPPAPGLR